MILKFLGVNAFKRDSKVPRLSWFSPWVPKFGLRVSKSGPWGLKFVPYIPKFDGVDGLGLMFTNGFPIHQLMNRSKI